MARPVEKSGYCKIRKKSEREHNKLVAATASQLEEDILKLYETKEHSDITVHIDGRPIQLHKAILWARMFQNNPNVGELFLEESSLSTAHPPMTCTTHNSDPLRDFRELYTGTSDSNYLNTYVWENDDLNIHHSKKVGPPERQSETQGHSETQGQSETQGHSETQWHSETQGHSERHKHSEKDGYSDTNKETVNCKNVNSCDSEPANGKITLVGAGVPDMAYSTLGRDLVALYRSGRYTDVSLVAGDEEFRVHRCILSCRSEYFSMMLSGNWNEAEKQTISLMGVTPAALDQALIYLYGGTIDVSPNCPLTDVVILADMYAIHGLKETVEFCMIRDFCHFFPETPCQGCIVGVPKVLPLARIYCLDGIATPAVAWITTHYVRVWPNKAFSQLPQEIREESCNRLIESISRNSIVGLINDLSTIEGRLPFIRWADIVRQHIDVLKSKTEVFLRNNIDSVASSFFCLTDNHTSWMIAWIESHFSAALNAMPREKMCQTYAAFRSIKEHCKCLYGNLSPRGEAQLIFASQELTDLAEKLHAKCRTVLIANAAYLVDSEHWDLLSKKEQKDIKEAALYVCVTGARPKPAQRPVLSSMARKTKPKPTAKNTAPQTREVKSRKQVSKVSSTNRTKPTNKHEPNNNITNKAQPVVADQEPICNDIEDNTDEQLQDQNEFVISNVELETLAEPCLFICDLIPIYTVITS